MIDLRSDTVTAPCDGMRAAIAQAPVGDDQFGEDPSVNQLQERVAQLLNKPAALWFPTGTMANQVALKLFTRPGDDVIVSRQSHAIWHEGGGSGANAGVQFTEVGDRGVFTAAQFEEAIKPRNHPMYPPTTLVEIENTHNRMGGVVFEHEQAEKICALARTHKISTYLDGARLWNAALVSGQSPATLCAPFDLTMVSLSKGLGAPGGSLLVGDAQLMQMALRFRRMLGGAMRQVGIFAAAGAYALEHNMARLEQDHHNARAIAAVLARCRHLQIDEASVQTNILVFQTSGFDPQAPDAPTLVQRARDRGVLAFAFDRRTIRIVTHRDVTAADCTNAAQILVACAMP
ncbi:MAG: GntG family PLP-dependent aldolase [Burkholderiaceae bacterium]